MTHKICDGDGKPIDLPLPDELRALLAAERLRLARMEGEIVHRLAHIRRQWSFNEVDVFRPVEDILRLRAWVDLIEQGLAANESTHAFLDDCIREQQRGTFTLIKPDKE